MDYSLSEKEQKLWERAKAFTLEHITPHAHELEKKNEFPKEVVQKAFEAGLMNLHIPTEAGGPGLSLLDETFVSEATGYGCAGLATTDETFVSEATGYGCAGLATTIMCNNLAFTPLIVGATTEQLKKYVEPLITGKEAKFGSFCLTERGAGSDAGAVATRAERDGDEYIINGVKCYATNGPQASLFTVFVTTQPELKTKGLSCFMVPKSKATKIGHIENKMGQRNSVQSEVIFEDARVPKDCLVGKEGDGFRIAMTTLDKTRAGIAAIATGVAQRAVDEAAKFANIRHQFGQSIGRFQGISFMLADMGARAAAARQLTRYSAWMADQGMRNSKDSAFAKFFASELMRDAKLLQIYEGTNQIQRLVAGSNILRESANLDTGFHVKYDGRDAPIM